MRGWASRIGCTVRILTRMTTKRARQDMIRELIDGRVISSQEELRGLLQEHGWEVTQSTLSRDLRDMRVARIPTASGVRYALAPSSDEESRLVLSVLLPQLYNGADGVGELVVLHTLSGGANTIAEALDLEEWPDVLGTIAGDDTILLICRSASARARTIRRLRTIAGERPEQGE